MFVQAVFAPDVLPGGLDGVVHDLRVVALSNDAFEDGHRVIRERGRGAHGVVEVVGAVVGVGAVGVIVGHVSLGCGWVSLWYIGKEGNEMCKTGEWVGVDCGRSSRGSWRFLCCKWRVKGAPFVQGLRFLACDSVRLLHVEASFTYSSLSEVS